VPRKKRYNLRVLKVISMKKTKFVKLWKMIRYSKTKKGISKAGWEGEMSMVML